MSISVFNFGSTPSKKQPSKNGLRSAGVSDARRRRLQAILLVWHAEDQWQIIYFTPETRREQETLSVVDFQVHKLFIQHNDLIQSSTFSTSRVFTHLR